MLMKGSVHLDWVIALIVFFTSVIVAYLYASSYVRTTPTSMDEATVQLTTEIYRQVMEKSGIGVKEYTARFPTSHCSTNYPCTLKMKTSMNVSVIDQDSNKLLFDFDGSKIRLLLNTCEKANILILNSSVSVVGGDAWINTNSLGNTNISVNYNTTHIIQIYYNSIPLLKLPAYLSTTTISARESKNTESKVIYDSANLSVDSNSTRIWLSFSQPTTVNFTLPLYDYCYIDNTLYSCSSITTISTVTNLTTFYNSTAGISFIGKNLNVTINNTGYELILEIKNATLIEMLLHKNSIDAAKNESNLIFEECQIGMGNYFKAVDKYKLEGLSSIELNTNFNYRAEIDNVSFGKTVPLTRNVYRRDMPLIVVDDGSLNTSTLTVWVWQ